MSQVRDNIEREHYDKLQEAILTDKHLRPNSKQKLQRTFCILFFTGVRLNEVQELLIGNIVELHTNGITSFITPKTTTRRELFISPDFKTEIEKYFDLQENPDHKVIRKNRHPKTGIGNMEYIKQTNKFMHKVLGEGFRTHSFRQGILTQFCTEGKSEAIAQRFIGHASIDSTRSYFKPTAKDVMMNLVR